MHVINLMDKHCKIEYTPEMSALLYNLSIKFNINIVARLYNIEQSGEFKSSYPNGMVVFKEVQTQLANVTSSPCLDIWKI